MALTNYTVDLSWAPDSPSVLNFTNCTLATTWMTQLIEDSLPFQATSQYLLDGLHGYLASSNSSVIPSDLSLITWYATAEGNATDQMVDKMWAFAYSPACLPQFCQSVGWSGNADIAGRGMLVNYILQAVLATLYAFVLVKSRLRKAKTNSLTKEPTPSKDSTFRARGLAAIQHTSLTFLDASILFTISMLIAGVYFFASNLLDGSKKAMTVYSMLTSSFLPLYSLLPTLVLNACISDDLRRVKWRRGVWAFMSLLTLALGALLVTALFRYPQNDSAFQDDLHEFAWQAKCEDTDMAMVVFAALGVLFAIFIILAIIYTFLFLLARCLKRVRFIQAIRNKWWLCIAVLGFLGMWICLGIFIKFRNQTVSNSGTENGDKEWTFGQVLGLITWVPVVIELAFLWREGVKEGTVGRLMSPLVVVDDCGKEVKVEVVRVDTREKMKVKDVEGFSYVEIRG